MEILLDSIAVILICLILSFTIIVIASPSTWFVLLPALTVCASLLVPLALGV